MPLTIQISDETVEKLNLIKHPGQTWDGCIQELLGSRPFQREVQRDEAKKETPTGVAAPADR